MEEPAVSIAGTRGNPPCSSVESIREKLATWCFSRISPKSGRLRIIRSMRSAPRSVSFQRQKTKTANDQPDKDKRCIFLRILPYFQHEHRNRRQLGIEAVK